MWEQMGNIFKVNKGQRRKNKSLHNNNLLLCNKFEMPARLLDIDVYRGSWTHRTRRENRARDIHRGSPMLLMQCVLINCSLLSNSLQHHRLLAARVLGSWNFPAKNTGMGCHFLLQGIFLTQGSNPHFLCKEPRSALESRRVSLGAHWVDSRESSLLRRLERGREIGL